MPTLHQKLQLASHNEIASILQADSEVLQALLKEHTLRQEFEKLKLQLKKNAVKKKQDDDEFFAALDISAFLKHTKLSILLNARKQEVLKALEKEALFFKETLRLQKAYIEAAKKQPSSQLILARSLLEKAFIYEAHLSSIIAEYNRLQQHINNWEAAEWRPAVTSAAKIAADAIDAQLTVDLARNPVVQTLQDALGKLPNGNALVDEIDQARQDLKAIIADRLSNRPSFDVLCKQVPAFAEAVHARCKDPHDPKEIKAAITKEFDPRAKLLNQIILASNLRLFYKHIEEMCYKHGLNNTYKEVLEELKPMHLAVKKGANEEKYQAFLDDYHNDLKLKYNHHIDDQCQLYKLAQQGDELKKHLVDTLERLKQLTPTLESSTTMRKRKLEIPSNESNKKLKR